MSIQERINEDLKSAMKAGEKDKLMALRDIKSKLLLEMTKDGGDGAVDGGFLHEGTDDAEVFFGFFAVHGGGLC